MADEEKEIKLIINMKGTRAIIGVQSPDSDPVMERAEGNMSDVFVAAGVLVERAKEQWKASPRNPKSEIPASEKPAPTAATSDTPAKASARPVPSAAKQGPQPKMF